MRFDFYVRFVLTVIAACLVFQLFRSNPSYVEAANNRKNLTYEAERIINEAESRQDELINYASRINSEMLSGKISAVRANAIFQYTIAQQNDVLVSINSGILKVLLSNNEMLNESMSKK